MPSFDVVSKVDFQEVDNAINQAQKEITNRYDFKGVKAELTRNDSELVIHAQNDSKLEAMKQVLYSKLTKRGIDIRSIEIKNSEPATGGTIREHLLIKDGLDKETSKKITKFIKDLKIKVQSQIQDDMVRVSGKKIDDLQSVIQSLKNAEEIDLPLQFINMRD